VWHSVALERLPSTTHQPIPVAHAQQTLCATQSPAKRGYARWDNTLMVVMRARIALKAIIAVMELPRQQRPQTTLPRHWPPVKFRVLSGTSVPQDLNLLKQCVYKPMVNGPMSVLVRAVQAISHSQLTSKVPILAMAILVNLQLMQVVYSAFRTQSTTPLLLGLERNKIKRPTRLLVMKRNPFLRTTKFHACLVRQIPQMLVVQLLQKTQKQSKE
jgi:hypothetical protein